MTTTRERMALNFIKSRGREAFRTLTDLLVRQESGQVIADTFGVSRERVRHWKNAFGQTVTVYQVFSDIENLPDQEPKPKPVKKTVLTLLPDLKK